MNSVGNMTPPKIISVNLNYEHYEYYHFVKGGGEYIV